MSEEHILDSGMISIINVESDGTIHLKNGKGSGAQRFMMKLVEIESTSLSSMTDTQLLDAIERWQAILMLEKVSTNIYMLNFPVELNQQIDLWRERRMNEKDEIVIAQIDYQLEVFYKAASELRSPRFYGAVYDKDKELLDEQVKVYCNNYDMLFGAHEVAPKDVKRVLRKIMDPSLKNV